MSSLANEEVLKHIARCTFCFVNNDMSVRGVPRTQLSKIEIKFTYVYSLLQSLIDIYMYSFPISITCHCYTFRYFRNILESHFIILYKTILFYIYIYLQTIEQRSYN